MSIPGWLAVVFNLFIGWVGLTLFLISGVYYGGATAHCTRRHLLCRILCSNIMMRARDVQISRLIVALDFKNFLDKNTSLLFNS